VRVELHKVGGKMRRGEERKRRGEGRKIM